jgi:hypothetical protein
MKQTVGISIQNKFINPPFARGLGINRDSGPVEELALYAA